MLQDSPTGLAQEVAGVEVVGDFKLGQWSI